MLNLNVPDSRENILEMMTTDCMCDYVYNIISLVSFIFLCRILFLKVILKLLLKLNGNSGKSGVACFACLHCFIYPKGKESECKPGKVCLV